MKIERYFSKDDKLDKIEYKKINIEIKNNKGELIYELFDAEFPVFYSENACKIIASKYFRDTKEYKETSIKQLVFRMSKFWCNQLIQMKLIKEEDSLVLQDELMYTMLTQQWLPNSPQMFNTGLALMGHKGKAIGHFYYDKDKKEVVKSDDEYTRTQGSACFITAVKDSLFGEQSLTENLVTDTLLFKGGSGVGTNWSLVRGKNESLSGGGKSSGVLSFLNISDKNAGTIKSGGTRRSAKMNILDYNHPEILEFIDWKAKEEDKGETLKEAGYDSSIQGDIYLTLSGQNSNNSIRLSNEFMSLKDEDIVDLISPNTKEVISSVTKKEIVDKLSYSAWRCGDPAVQFSTTINNWNTCIFDGDGNETKINASNPCFTGSMRLLTTEGYKTFKELSGKRVDLIKPDGTISKNCKVWCSGVKQVISLLLGNRVKISCTPNHLFRTKNGTEVEAQFTQNLELETYDYFPNCHEELQLEKENTSKSGKCTLELFFKDKESLYIYRNKVGSYISDFHYGVTTYQASNGEYVMELTGKQEILNYIFTIGLKDKELEDFFLKSNSIAVCNVSDLSSKKVKVYDFEEPENHWGIVEGVVVHNCSEFLFLDNTACNLASINLMKFYDLELKTFDFEGFSQLCKIITLILEATVEGSHYPTKQIAENSYKYRPIGLGVTNLGALIFAMGLSYESVEARLFASVICSLMTSEAYKTSYLMAQEIGSFENYKYNKKSFEHVLYNHTQKVNEYSTDNENLEFAIQKIASNYLEVMSNIEQYGVRNSQVTVIAPTGTISLAMDCLTTSCEPFFTHDIEKTLADGDKMLFNNNLFSYVLNNLGCNDISELSDDQKKIFSTAIDCGFGEISPAGHISMVSNIQDCISGGISKTVNLPETASPQDIWDIYQLAWESGLKCISVYRNNCKIAQPLNNKIRVKKPTELTRVKPKGIRDAKVHEVCIGRLKLYVTISYYSDGGIGEIYINSGKQGSLIKGLLDSISITLSKMLQYGVPPKDISKMYRGQRYEPSGIVTNHPYIKYVDSISDLISKILDIECGDFEYCQIKPDNYEQKAHEITNVSGKDIIYGEICVVCQGDKMVRSGTCYTCVNCGSTTGCS